MHLHRQLAALLIVLALAGSAQGITGQAGAPNTPHSRENTGNVPEHGGGDGSVLPRRSDPGCLPSTGRYRHACARGHPDGRPNGALPQGARLREGVRRSPDRHVFGAGEALRRDVPVNVAARIGDFFRAIVTARCR
jgi:hypothetical protein